MELIELKGWQLREKILNGDVDIIELVKSYLKKIKETDGKIHAYVYFDEEKVIKRAKELKNKKKGKLYGLPISIKDNICVKDEPTTCCSRILKDFSPPYNATVIEKLESEGAILLGKTNMDEFAFGSSCETSCYGPTRNPYDLERVPGGSSGGSAASVSAKEALWALGSDTGGSIRQPASLCGVVGLKPTYGRVSRYGLIAFASSLDQIGPITKDVKDSAFLFEVIAGWDPHDSTSVDVDIEEYIKYLDNNDIRGIKIGIPLEYIEEGIDEDVRKRLNESIKIFEKLGAEVENTSLPHTQYAISCYYIIAPSEASSNLARYDGVQYGLRENVEYNLETNPMVEMYLKTRSEGFGPEAKRRIILGTYALSSGYYEAYYLQASKVRTLIRNDFQEAFKKYDILLTPTSPTTAFKIGERISDPLTMYLSDIFTIPANLAGIPAISIPAGFDKKGLPIGIQLMGRPFEEKEIFKVAHAYEYTVEN
jgi:aspartyl-tRNA(Asn)/glutamyl-tRNA(Gln) amidotransferase subunit A